MPSLGRDIPLMTRIKTYSTQLTVGQQNSDAISIFSPVHSEKQAPRKGQHESVSRPRGVPQGNTTQVVPSVITDLLLQTLPSISNCRK